MEILSTFIDFFLHLDKHLDAAIQSYGMWTYSILFIVVFCETGLVVTPILPGDSLLFAAGALAGRGSMNVGLVALLLTVAAILGDTINYQVGYFIGPKVFQKKDSKIFRQEWLERTQGFFARYGKKAIVIARFVPIVRTFAPFLAGVGKMNYFSFLAYNVVGGVLWVSICVFAGYLFGELPIVKNNFTLVILGIIAVSLMPAVFEFLRVKREGAAVSKGA